MWDGRVGRLATEKGVDNWLAWGIGSVDERSGIEKKRPDNHKVYAVPPASALVQQLAQRSGIELSEHGRRKLGKSSDARRDVIGRRIGV